MAVGKKNQQDPAAWHAQDMKQRAHEWTYVLSDEDLAEIEKALDACKHYSNIQDITAAEFHLPTLGPKLKLFGQEIILAGVFAGFQLIKGLPVERYSVEDCTRIYWGFGLHWGRVVQQNKNAHLIGHVRVSAEAPLPVSVLGVDRAISCCCLALELVQVHAAAYQNLKGLCWNSHINRLGHDDQQLTDVPLSFTSHLLQHHAFMVQGTDGVTDSSMHLQDIHAGRGLENPVNRLYTSNAAQPFHVDDADVVAKAGGLSGWASSRAIYQRLQQTHPEYVEVLSQDLYLDRKNEIPEGKKPYYALPVFNHHKALTSSAHTSLCKLGLSSARQGHSSTWGGAMPARDLHTVKLKQCGRICTFYASGYYQVCQRHADVPRLTQLQHAAFAEFERLAGSDEFFMDYELQPGDIQVGRIVFLSSHLQELACNGPDGNCDGRHLSCHWTSV
ncbi:hypothetical protein MMC29_003606 [Sticta canariensis]|nr:hypothetical protein [Sticta canariensis]